MGSAYQLVIVISILLAQILGNAKVLGTPDLWTVLLGITVIPGIIQVAMLVFCYDSPKYLLIVKKNEAKAMKGGIFIIKIEASNCC